MHGEIAESLHGAQGRLEQWTGAIDWSNGLEKWIKQEKDQELILEDLLEQELRLEKPLEQGVLVDKDWRKISSSNLNWR